MASTTNSRIVIAALTILLLNSSIFTTNAQQTINTPCTSSMISTFTPCLNFVTGSSGSGSSPTQDCCNALKSLTVNNMDCACLIITGNVPLSIPFINANLGIALPRACKSSVPLQCSASGVPLPPPGPVLFAPPPPPPPPALVPRIHAPTPAPAPAPAPAPYHSHAHAHSPKGSKATTTTAAPPPFESSDIAPAPATPHFPLGPGANPGIRPVVNHNSSASNFITVSFSCLVIIFGGIIASKFV